ncbi:hypothetical protein [Serratia grimesii]|uniref:hypothetical protein n=1 Tax=Serratia grimesii TaxID=82995 RepID=UPI0039B0ADF1
MSSLISGKSPSSKLLFHWSRACASINESIPDFNIRSRQMLRSMLRVMAFIAVSVFP